MRKLTMALYYGNRGFFPGEVIAAARKEMRAVCEKCGLNVLELDEKATKFGAVETIAEGKAYAEFLRAHAGEYQGVILCLPNFGDENGAAVALENAGVPILVQAYPDEPDKMDFAHRRDALCGKLAMCNVLRQKGIRFTQTARFAVHPSRAEFAEDLLKFAAVCRTVQGMKRFNVGVIGARTSAFKTVRYDELALMSKGINTEAIDLSEVFARMERVEKSKTDAKKKAYAELSDFGGFSDKKLTDIAKLGCAIDELIEEYDLQAVAVRCWDEMQKTYGIAPCLILGELNERGIAASCETDVTNAVMMRAMGLAADFPVVLLDVNNNYGDSLDKAVCFHCGPAPKSLMKGKGRIEEHLMFRKTYGEGSGVGINKGEYISCAATVGSCKTENGKIHAFVTQGNLTDDALSEEFFGCGKVLQKENMNDMLRYMADNGYRHHVCITKGNFADAVTEAFRYLGYETDLI